MQIINATTNPITVQLTSFAEPLILPPNQIISFKQTNVSQTVAIYCPATDDSQTVTGAKPDTIISYITGYATQCDAPGIQSYTQAAVQGATAGGIIMAAIMTFILVRRAWTIGDRASID